MRREYRRWATAVLALATWIVVGSAGGHFALAASPGAKATARAAASKKIPALQKVELFRAMQSGQLEVKLIPKNAKQATVVIRNKSKQPLRIQLPEAFAGVPVLAQVGDIGGGRDRGGLGGNNSTSNQSFGGGMGMGMGGMGMGGMGMGGMFNVGPEAVRKLKVATVCLEHGKPDPNPRVPYALRPIESYTGDARVVQLCKMLGNGKIDQHAAQAAAWHLTDQLSWQQLAAKVKVRHLNGTTEVYFTPRDLQRAMQVVQVATHRARQQQLEGKSPGVIESDPYYGQAASGASRE